MGSDVDRTAAALSDYFRSQTTAAGEIAAVYLFGSVARNAAGPASDVDVGLAYVRPPPRTLGGQPFDVAADLAQLLGRPVDVVVMNGAPSDLVHRILRDGRVVFEGDRSARIAFEVRARNHYFDMLPILRRYRRTALAR